MNVVSKISYRRRLSLLTLPGMFLIPPAPAACHLLDPLVTLWSNLKYPVVRKSFPIPLSPNYRALSEPPVFFHRVMIVFDVICWLFEVDIPLPEGTQSLLPE